MASAKATRLDPQNPWPGLESFSELDVEYFHGRDAETAELLRLVKREPVTVLFGTSGLGKTSLINAGLFPALRRLDFIPAYVRIDFSEEAPAPRDQMLAALLAECARQDIDARQPDEGETLWEYFHRSDTEFWNPRNRPVTPVIALDQFEEVFTLGQMTEVARARARDFLVELGDLIENRTPRHVKAALDGDPGLAARYDFRKLAFKLTISFREDYLAHFEGLKQQIPSLVYNRMRLTPMNGLQAEAVVTESGGHLVAKGVTPIIIGMAAGSGSVQSLPDPAGYAELHIDPALLSVICSELNGRRKRAGDERITRDLISGAEHEILADFYERSMAGRDPRVRAFVEDELLTQDGRHRDSFDRDDALRLPGITQADLDALVAGRLLRVDDRLGRPKLELTHDVLTKVVRDSRDSRKAREREAAAQVREREAARRQRRNRAYSALLALGFVGVVAAGWYVYDLNQRVVAEKARAAQLSAAVQAEQRRTEEEKLRAAQQTARANTLKQEAEAQKALADEATELAARQRARADEQTAFANELLDRAQATRLVSQAEQFQDSRYDLSLLLNVEAARRAPGLVEARAGMLARFQSHPQLDSFVAGDEPLFTVAFDPSPANRFVASAGKGGSVRLFNPSTRATMLTLPAQPTGVLGLAISPGGKTLATAGADGTLMLWDVTAGSAAPRRPIATWDGHGQRVLGVAFSPDGKTLASASYDGRLRLWSLATRELQGPEMVHGDRAVLGLAFRPGGRLLASAGEDGTVALWDAQTGRPLGRLRNERDPRVWGLAFSPDGNILAAAYDDGLVSLWNPDTRQLIRTLDGRPGSVRNLAFSPDGKRLAGAWEDGAVKVWDLARADAPPATLHGHRKDKVVQGVAFSPDGARLASVGDDGQLILWHAPGAPGGEASSGFRTLAGRTGGVQHLAFDRAGRRLALADIDQGVTLWDVATGQRQPAMQGGETAARAVAFHPNGRQLISGGDDRQVTVWDPATGVAQRQLPTEAAVRALAYSQDGRLAAAAGRPGKDGRVTVRLWDTRHWKPAGSLTASGWVWGMGFGPDGKSLALAQQDKRVSLWDLPTGRKLVDLDGHGEPVRDLAFSPDRSLLASAGEDGRVILWQLDTRKRRATLVGHRGPVLSLAFSADGKMLASASRDGQVILWDVEAGKPMVTLAGHAEDSTSVAVSSDGAWIASAAKDRTVRLWDWAAQPLSDQACRVANRNLSCDEWRQYIGAEKYRKTCDSLPAPTCPRGG